MLNNVIIMGRLCAAPELKHTQNGTAVTAFTIAVERDYSSGNEKRTDFLDVVAWRSTAEFVTKYFGKGQLIAVKGSLRTEIYDKDGEKRKRVNIVADQVYFAGSKAKDAESAPSSDYEEVTFGDDEDLPF